MEQKDEISYVKRILDGETELFSVFLDSYSHSLYSLIVQIVRCPEDAEELVQDVFLKAFRHLQRYKGEGRFSTWLYRIAYNEAISATRKKKQEYFCIEEDIINNLPDEKIENLMDPTEDEEKIICLGQAIDDLNTEERFLITLFYYEDKSLEEISQIMSVTVGNVKVKLHRTRKKLYVLMSERYGNKE